MITTGHGSTEAITTTGTSEATPRELGVGMRFSLHPHTDDFVRVILDSLAEVEASGAGEGLVIETDEVSTYVGARAVPAEQDLAGYLVAAIAAASRHSGGGHVAAHVLFSRGCPGERTCDLTSTILPEVAPVRLEPTGIEAVAQWSLYPLLDGGDDAGEHMSIIEAAITRAQARGVAAPAAHYATKFTGDLAEVVATAVDAWARVGTTVPHVATHLTISVGSPTPARGT
ncbi:YkoF family thiamine/hydroxymethylpyrimidine-binding protein [Pseudactinotalea sp. Z1748]|uniref:YkoF family thiamine/hydroxymethylpyrimidine-binding protein n=1 Tax=Pseudactinotalea sp. Z1748 TaxID=3413027 RepID=UPI003C79F14F